MKRVSGGSRRIGGSGRSGFSRSSRSSSSFGRTGSLFGRSSSFGKPGSSGFNHINRHHSHMYRRYYGNSILPGWVRIVFYIILIIIAMFIMN
ncbi:MAG: hypothetical protein KAJ22_05235 [Candidatus Izimaplasma sp.]|nr:hypothetical protein [Candidatus Izimaplasma bacterium]